MCDARIGNPLRLCVDLERSSQRVNFRFNIQLGTIETDRVVLARYVLYVMGGG